RRPHPPRRRLARPSHPRPRTGLPSPPDLIPRWRCEHIAFPRAQETGKAPDPLRQCKCARLSTSTRCCPNTSRSERRDEAVRLGDPPDCDPAHAGVRTSGMGVVVLPDVEEERLVRLIARGDRAAFDELYRRTSPWLAVRLRRRCADDELVAEVMQET